MGRSDVVHRLADSFIRRGVLVPVSLDLMEGVPLMLFSTWLKRSPRRPIVKPDHSARPRSVQLLIEELEARRVLSTFVVSNTLDAAPNGPEGSFRWAIQQANAASGPQRIEFHLPGSTTHTIQLVAALPQVTQPVTIDGTTQAGYTVYPVIQLDGSRAGSTANGLTIAGGNSTVLGLDIVNFDGDGIHLQGAGGDVIRNNFIGVDLTGSVRLRNGGSGVAIVGSANNTVGGTDPTAGNLLSGNRQQGVYVAGSAATGNQVLGNYVGTNVTGLSTLGNDGQGVFISYAPGNTVGGTAVGAANLLSGNQGGAVWIEGASGTQVLGNLMGTDITGGGALANGRGVSLVNADHNTIGGVDPAARNVISGNASDGVWITGAQATANQILGNYIGTDVTGGARLRNGFNGVYIVGAASNNTIGGLDAGAGNVIAAGPNGIQIADRATGNQILGNLIGTDASGTVALGNTTAGVLINAPGNTVGGTAPGALNVISGNAVIPGNAGEGVVLFGAEANHNVVQGNLIGTDISGTAALANGVHGIDIIGASQNTIGGSDAGAGNFISANRGAGINVTGSGAAGNTIQANVIGLGADYATPLGNRAGGILFSGGAHDNLVGGFVPGLFGNLIANNVGAGVEVTVGPANTIVGNTMLGNGNATVQGIVLHGANLPAMPALTTATFDGSVVTVQGNYTGMANTAYLLDFFANNAEHPSGYGEGEIELGLLFVTTDATGQAAFSFDFSVGDLTGMFVSATATPPSGTTSQYAGDVQIGPATGPSAGGSGAVRAAAFLVVSREEAGQLATTGLTLAGDGGAVRQAVSSVAVPSTVEGVDLFFGDVAHALAGSARLAQRTPWNADDITNVFDKLF